MKTIFAIVAVFASISFGIYFLWNNNQNKSESSPSPTPIIEIQSPELVVETFYTTYLNCLKRQFENLEDNQSTGSNNQECSYNLTGALSDSYAQTIQAQGADPILCAQDLPTSISVAPSNIQANNATTTVHEKFERDNPVTIDLKLENNQWKITNITCHPPGVAPVQP